MLYPLYVLLLSLLASGVASDTVDPEDLRTMAKCLRQLGLSESMQAGHNGGGTFLMVAPQRTPELDGRVMNSVKQCYKEAYLFCQYGLLFGVEKIKYVHDACLMDDIADGVIDISPYIKIYRPLEACLLCTPFLFWHNCAPTLLDQCPA